MAATTVAGAASRSAADWQTIDWSKAHREVRRLQARIVQATQAGCWGKVQALQRLLTHSFSGKAYVCRQEEQEQIEQRRTDRQRHRLAVPFEAHGVDL